MELYGSLLPCSSNYSGNRFVQDLLCVICSAELVFDNVIIIKWLEVSFRKCVQQIETPQTNNPIFSRDMVQATERLVLGYDHFLGELLRLDLKKNLCQRGQRLAGFQ